MNRGFRVFELSSSIRLFDLPPETRKLEKPRSFKNVNVWLRFGTHCESMKPG